MIMNHLELENYHGKVGELIGDKKKSTLSFILKVLLTSIEILSLVGFEVNYYKNKFANNFKKQN